jgi:hypothetical protein
MDIETMQVHVFTILCLMHYFMSYALFYVLCTILCLMHLVLATI